MKKYIFALSAIMAGILIGGCSQKEVDEYAMITFMIGDVKKNSAEVQIGDIIKENDMIVTADNSFCDIKIGESIIRIKSLSNVKISTLFKNGNVENTTLGLDTGKMLCKPKKLLKDENFFVKTPTAVAGVRGTQFVVETDKAFTTRIKVFKGEVKVAKRVKQLESSMEKVLTFAPVVQQEEKVVITADEVKKAEKIVEASLKKETAGTTPSDTVIDRVINDTKSDVVVSSASIVKFAANDFTKENRELIEVEQKPKEDLAKIGHIIRQQKEKPVPEGRLLVTRYDIYYIKDGKIMWDGKVVNEPVKAGDKLYIASGEYVFCAQNDGPVLWRAKVDNDGKLEVKDGKVKVMSEGKNIVLDADNGKKL
ncbi:MAG TPA: FecR domain-containing protein [Spirochaetota bacterium]|nr:FecR domain-containing protein [Spirochaetota bacterium]HPS86858.1 FecR domain-containing protein [Spirochaetota bacterium]